MASFLILTTIIFTAAIFPSAEQGFIVNDTQDSAITLTAFEKNFDKVGMFAKIFCDEKGKQHKLNIEGSKKYIFPVGLNIYKYECLSHSTEKAVTDAPSSKEVTAEQEEAVTPEVAPVEQVVITNYSDEEQMQLAAEAEQARLVLTNAINESQSASSESKQVASSGCASNTFIGQEQVDGSWKTICKE